MDALKEHCDREHEQDNKRRAGNVSYGNACPPAKTVSREFVANVATKQVHLFVSDHVKDKFGARVD